ncbi:MAG: hypothetical protein FD124_2820 [Alphaproteobacteria bacterium]|nr:MAG: hypothetical protein FD160_758 [Caulobacteraceae bacterium]TPW03918.1 MAG: hypothetical protein FD124_2820 [Alphaproteobacteria bacterium]
MTTRRDIALGLPAAALLAALPGMASAQETQPAPPVAPPAAGDDTFTEDEVVQAAEDFLDTAAGSVAAVIARVFREQGRPVGYITGREGSGAWLVGLRYGKGLMFLKSGERTEVNWQGPSFGFDFGGNASKVFTLIYGMTSAEQIYKRYPGVDGSAYVIGGLGVNYQAADGVTLAPIRAGVGLRAGASVGYLNYTRTRHILPF